MIGLVGLIKVKNEGREDRVGPHTSFGPQAPNYSWEIKFTINNRLV
jgi:hypothetical protein